MTQHTFVDSSEIEPFGYFINYLIHYPVSQELSWKCRCSLDSTGDPGDSLPRSLTLFWLQLEQDFTFNAVSTFPLFDSRSRVLALSIEWLSICSPLFYLGFYYSPSSPPLPPPSVGVFFFGSSEFPQLSQLLNGYLGMADGRRNASFIWLCSGGRISTVPGGDWTERFARKEKSCFLLVLVLKIV